TGTPVPLVLPSTSTTRPPRGEPTGEGWAGMEHTEPQEPVTPASDPAEAPGQAEAVAARGGASSPASAGASAPDDAGAGSPRRESAGEGPPPGELPRADRTKATGEASLAKPAETADGDPADGDAAAPDPG